MKKKLISFLLNTYFITLIISAVIIYLLPDYYSKYKVELVVENKLSQLGKAHFKDLNGDELPEKIVSRLNVNKEACFDIYNENDDFLNQINLGGNYTKSPNPLWFFDVDNDGKKEVLAFTQSNDSVYLSTYFFVKNTPIKKVFIDNITPYNDLHNIWIDFVKFEDNTMELFFSLNAGYSGNPRNIYKYNTKFKSIIKSPHLTNRGSVNEIIDIDNDGTKEVILMNHSSGNEIDSVYTLRSDHSSWITVLDNNLNFKFQPIEIHNPYSYLYPAILKNEKKIELFITVRSHNKAISPNKILHISSNGTILNERIIENGLIFNLEDENKKNILIYNRDIGFLQKFNFDLTETKKTSLSNEKSLVQLNIGNGYNKGKVIILYSFDDSKLLIYDKNFKNETILELPRISDESTYFGTRKELDNHQLVIQKGRYYYVYNYFKNPLFYFKYLIYLGVFGVVYLLIWLISKGQKMRMEKQLAIQSEIAEYQIKTIKNQVDPHFVFNAINTISGLMLEDDKLKADEFICQFSRLMRNTLEHSDKIICTLQEEVDFVENYIQLQQTRFNNRFSYTFKIDENVNLQQIVPKHILYSYIENAIKHGFSNASKGELKISIKEDKALTLIIENSDANFKRIQKNSLNSSENGLKIMEKVYELFFKLRKKKINHQINPIFDESNTEIGYSVTVIISK